MDLLLPISQDTLKALTRDPFGASRSQSAAIWSAVQARHHKSSLEPPLGKLREFTASKRALAHIMGRPLVLKLPIHRLVVARLAGSGASGPTAGRIIRIDPPRSSLRLPACARRAYRLRPAVRPPHRPGHPRLRGHLRGLREHPQNDSIRRVFGKAASLGWAAHAIPSAMSSSSAPRLDELDGPRG